jgi:hypothetical protein
MLELIFSFYSHILIINYIHRYYCLAYSRITIWPNGPARNRRADQRELFINVLWKPITSKPQRPAHRSPGFGA